MIGRTESAQTASTPGPGLQGKHAEDADDQKYFSCRHTQVVRVVLGGMACSGHIPMVVAEFQQRVVSAICRQAGRSLRPSAPSWRFLVILATSDCSPHGVHGRLVANQLTSDPPRLMGHENVGGSAMVGRPFRDPGTLVTNLLYVGHHGRLISATDCAWLACFSVILATSDCSPHGVHDRLVTNQLNF